MKNKTHRTTVEFPIDLWEYLQAEADKRSHKGNTAKAVCMYCISQEMARKDSSEIMTRKDAIEFASQVAALIVRNGLENAKQTRTT